MRRFVAALVLSLIAPFGAACAQSAPAYPTQPPPPPPTMAMPAEASPPEPLDVQPVDPELLALRGKVAWQNAVIANQKALITALNGRLVALKRKCP